MRILCESSGSYKDQSVKLRHCELKCTSYIAPKKLIEILTIAKDQWLLRRSERVNKTQLMADLNQMEELIRQGKLGAAREVLYQIRIPKIPRTLAYQVADLARRLNVNSFIIRILKPFLYNELAQPSELSEKEKALYARGLMGLGLYPEATQILESLDYSVCPEALLFQAYIKMFTWDYEKAIPLLSKYIEHPLISEYDLLVGEVNILASFVWSMNWLNAENSLARIHARLMKFQDRAKIKLIEDYSFELETEMYILKGDYEKALELITQIEVRFLNSKSRYEFYSKKWKAILHLMLEPNNPKCLQEVTNIKTLAFELKEWEVARDCDLYLAVALRDDSLFLKVLLGTPYEPFKRRALTIYRPKFPIPDHVTWILNKSYKDHTSKKNSEVDLQSIVDKLQRRSPLYVRILLIMTKDFYRPVNLGSLISALYPGEFYNPITTPRKTFQLLHRLRKWLKTENSPLTISVQNENFSLTTSCPTSLVVSRKTQAENKNEALYLELNNCLSIDSFNARIVAEELKISFRSAQRFLGWATKEQKLIRESSGPGTRYRIKKVA